MGRGLLNGIIITSLQPAPNDSDAKWYLFDIFALSLDTSSYLTEKAFSTILKNGYVEIFWSLTCILKALANGVMRLGRSRSA
ncbi:RNA polymerase, sigma-24 subunit, ECF subfamily [Alicyclobacillus hesperidum URH17-3-68]|nr:RNA polymerase, sigma-24 subunit, ECF subfamily [Alicyclobacillus hesperidum URH17-3-68]